MRTLFKNAHLVSAGIDNSGASLLVNDGLIEAVYRAGEKLPQAARIVDVNENYLLPGFIDIHFHGCLGADFCDATDEAFQTIGCGKIAEGVTSMLATTLTVGEENIFAALRAAARYASHPGDGSRLLGAHLEGPFINPEGAGAQNPAHLRCPDIALVHAARAICPVKVLSLSPELPGALDLIRQLAREGVMPSGAHSTADFDLFEQARAAGMKHLTHFCNIMTPLHHLRPGMVGGGLVADDVLVEIIADGVHLSDEMLKIIFRCKGANRIMLITDAMRAAGMPDGNYVLGELPVTVKNRRATLESGMVAGSVSRFHESLQHLRTLRMLPDAELIRCAGFNQAQSLGLDRVGALEAGYFADFVIADEKWHPLEVWKDGVCRYCHFQETVSSQA
jgi:N-acetylglucosamine-6-phosphate deacetylase